jgi:hypothetical protein
MNFRQIKINLPPTFGEDGTFLVSAGIKYDAVIQIKYIIVTEPDYPRHLNVLYDK